MNIQYEYCELLQNSSGATHHGDGQIKIISASRTLPHNLNSTGK